MCSHLLIAQEKELTSVQQQLVLAERNAESFQHMHQDQMDFHHKQLHELQCELDVTKRTLKKDKGDSNLKRKLTAKDAKIKQLTEMMQCMKRELADAKTALDNQ